MFGGNTYIQREISGYHWGYWETGYCWPELHDGQCNAWLQAIHGVFCRPHQRII